MPKKIIEEAIEDVKEELNEEVGTITVKRWKLIAAAAAVTIILLAVIL